MKIDGRTFFITGGASGLGLSAAEKLVEGGANVILFDLRKDNADAAAAKLGSRALAAGGNVLKEADVQAALDAGVAKFGGIHGVINCAGIGFPGRVIGRGGKVHKLEHFKMVLDINVVGTFNCLRLASAIIAKQDKLDEDGERGVIINTASVAAFDGQIGQAAYSASKGAVVGMTLPLARDLARWGIRCCTIAPGIFDTPMMAAMPEKGRRALERQVPFPSRLGASEEFGLLSKHIIENSYLNGETIRLDGSIRMAAM